MTPPTVHTSRDYELMTIVPPSDFPDFSPQNPPNFYGEENVGDYILAPNCGDRSSLCSSNYDSLDTMALMSDTRFDTIKHAPKNFVKIDDETLYKPEKDPAVDQVAVALQYTNIYSGYVTIPRSRVAAADNILTSKSQETAQIKLRIIYFNAGKNVNSCEQLKLSYFHGHLLTFFQLG